MKVVCFKEKIKETQAMVPKTVLGLCPIKGSVCSSETKHDRRMVPRQKLFYDEITEAEATTAKNLSWVQVLMKMISVDAISVNSKTNVLGCRDYIFTMIFNDRPERLIRKCLHLSNFPTAILQVLCW
jgi:hypothetical protein